MMSPTIEASIGIEINEVHQKFFANRALEALWMPPFIRTRTCGTDIEIFEVVQALKGKKYDPGLIFAGSSYGKIISGT